MMSIAKVVKKTTKKIIKVFSFAISRAREKGKGLLSNLIACLYVSYLSEEQSKNHLFLQANVV